MNDYQKKILFYMLIPQVKSIDYIYEIENDFAAARFYLKDKAFVKIPESFEDKEVNLIEATCFNGKSLTEVIIPDTVSEVE